MKLKRKIIDFILSRRVKKIKMRASRPDTLIVIKIQRAVRKYIIGKNILKLHKFIFASRLRQQITQEVKLKAFMHT